MVSGICSLTMDYTLNLVIFALFCHRITCIPLLNEMMGTNSGPLLTHQKDIKPASAATSVPQKPVPKLTGMSNNFMGALNNMLNKQPKSLPNAGTGMGILDNPLLAQQLNALLRQKPVNKGGLFSTFANPVFAAQLNKMFSTMPMGSMSSPKFLNNPLLGKQKAGQQALSKMSFFNKNTPLQNNKPHMKSSENLLNGKTNKQGSQLVTPSKAHMANDVTKLQPVSPKVPSTQSKAPTLPNELALQSNELLALQSNLPSSRSKLPTTPEKLPSPPKKLPPPPPAPQSSQPILPETPMIQPVSQAALPSSVNGMAGSTDTFAGSTEKFAGPTDTLSGPINTLTGSTSTSETVNGPADSLTGPMDTMAAQETDPLLLDAGMTDPIQTHDATLDLNVAGLQGMHKHPHASFDKPVPSTGFDMFDSLAQNTGMMTDVGNVQAVSKLGTSTEFTVNNKGVPPQLLQSPNSQKFAQVSNQGQITHQDPLQETMFGAPIEEMYKPPPAPRNEIGTVLNEMSQMVNNQSPLGGSAMDWKTSPMGTSFSSGVMPMKGDKVPIGMSWLSARGVGKAKPMGSAMPSIMQNVEITPKFEGTGLRSRQPVTTWKLKKDLGSLVGEAGPNYQEKKPIPKEIVCKKKDLYAVCNLAGNPSKPTFKNVTGALYLRQKIKKNCKYDWLNIQVDISNVPMNDGTLFHGMHIHEFGEMTNGCEAMGPHYNPTNTPHGAPWQPERLRHVGDLGNVRQRRKDGKIYTRIVDYVAQLEGPQSIIGRGIALKTARDDLGQGKGDSSKVTGNSGDMMACCVISRSRPHSDDIYTLY